MDSIKKKMLSLSAATEEATERAERFSEETRRTLEIAEKYEDQVGGTSLRRNFNWNFQRSTKGLLSTDYSSIVRGFLPSDVQISYIPTRQPHPPTHPDTHTLSADSCDYKGAYCEWYCNL